jgi:hypothetical protein
MKKLLIILFLIGEFNFVNAEENSATYGVKYNSTTEKNEIYLVNLDGTEEFLIDFRFPSNSWQGGNSFVDSKTGKIWLYQAEGSVCPIGGGLCRDMTEDEKGFLVYDPATNTIETGVKNGWGVGYQKTFNSVLKIDDLIKNDTSTSGNDISVIGSNELVDDESTVLIGNSTDVDGDAITVIGSNELVGENGNTLISEEENGEIHIGENSLVTVETDGVQLLYATDANGDQIDINIKAGTDLLVDGKSVTQALTDIDTNKTNIATNTTGIATNKTNIATNTTGIATNKTNIATNTTGIANNVVRLDSLGALAASNANRVEGLETLTGLMQNEYRSGIASSIALSQIQYSASGFSIGVGHGEFKNKDEMAVGIGYGGQFNEDVGFQFQFGSSDDSTGFGFTVRF